MDLKIGEETMVRPDPVIVNSGPNDVIGREGREVEDGNKEKVE